MEHGGGGIMSLGPRCVLKVEPVGLVERNLDMRVRGRVRDDF